MMVIDKIGLGLCSLCWSMKVSHCMCCRPHLVDYRLARHRSARENLDMAFNLFEREFGVTRLLDPEGQCMYTADC